MGWQSQAVIAQQVIIEGSSDGLFVYSGTPALGNLIASIANIGGTDSSGNTFLQGTTEYNAFGVGGQQEALNLNQGKLTWQLASGPGGVYSVTSRLQIDSSKDLQVTAAVDGTPVTLQLNDAGGATLTGGGLTVSTGGATVTAGGLTVSAGGAAVTGQSTVTAATNSALTVTSTAVSPSAAGTQLVANAVTDPTLGIKVSGDTNNRYQVDSDGKAHWGTGAAGADTNLYRSAANTLKTDQAFVAHAGLTVDTVGITVTAGGETITAGGLTVSAGGATITGQSSITGSVSPVFQVTDTSSAPAAAFTQLIANAAADKTFGIEVTGDTTNRLLVDSNGKHSWGPGNGAVDTTLYRSASALLVTDQVFGLTDHAAPSGVATTSQFYSATGQAAMVNASGQTSKVSGAKLAAIGGQTVTQAAFTNLFNDTILANDAKVGAVYKVVVFGSGTWGSTAQTLTFGARFGAAATNTVGTTPAISSTAFAVSAAFEWYTEIFAVNVTTGVSATWHVNITGTISETLNAVGAIPLAAASNTVPFTGGTTTGSPITLDSTASEILGLSAKWASTTGAPTLSAVAGWIQRIA